MLLENRPCGFDYVSKICPLNDGIYTAGCLPQVRRRGGGCVCVRACVLKRRGGGGRGFMFKPIGAQQRECHSSTL